MVWGVPDARADLVFLSSGRSFSVREVREEGNQLILALRTGGEIRCDRSLVVRITPDEMAYPEPAMAADVTEAYDTVTTPYRDLIDRASVTHGVDARLVRAVIQVESAYQSRARSPKGAMGLMQLMPETARRYAVAEPLRSGGKRRSRHPLPQVAARPFSAQHRAGRLQCGRGGGGAVRRGPSLPGNPRVRRAHLEACQRPRRHAVATTELLGRRRGLKLVFRHALVSESLPFRDRRTRRRPNENWYNPVSIMSTQTTRCSRFRAERSRREKA